MNMFRFDICSMCNVHTRYALISQQILLTFTHQPAETVRILVHYQVIKMLYLIYVLQMIVKR